MKYETWEVSVTIKGKFEDVEETLDEIKMIDNGVKIQIGIVYEVDEDK